MSKFRQRQAMFVQIMITSTVCKVNSMQIRITCALLARIKISQKNFINITFFSIKLSKNKPAYFRLLILCEGNKPIFINLDVNQILPKKNAFGVVEITVLLL